MAFDETQWQKLIVTSKKAQINLGPVKGVTETVVDYLNRHETQAI